jgi:SAM-dependent methyltransferase
MGTATAGPAEDALAPHAWGRAPDLYGPRHAYREGLLMRRLRRELDGGHVLNAGCGAGSFTLALHARGYPVTSVDSSDLFVKHLQERLAEQGGDPERVEPGNVERLRFGDETFDCVVSGEVLEHLDDDTAALREFERVLKPGGLLLVSVPANPWRYDWCDHWAGHQRRYTVGGLDQRLATAGFSEREVLPYGFPLTGLFHRRVYKPMLRRRLEGGDTAPGGAAGAQRLVAPLVRWALELDTLFIGRRPGYFGLIAVARKPAAAR